MQHKRNTRSSKNGSSQCNPSTVAETWKARRESQPSCKYWSALLISQQRVLFASQPRSVHKKLMKYDSISSKFSFVFDVFFFHKTLDGEKSLTRNVIKNKLNRTTKRELLIRKMIRLKKGYMRRWLEVTKVVISY